MAGNKVADNIAAYQTAPPAPPVCVMFSHEKMQSAIKLTWKVDNLSAGDSFILQRSINGQEFHRFAACGYMQPVSYEQIDTSTAAATAAKVLYRLLVKRISGHEIFVCDPITVNNSSNSILLIKPNPAKETTTILCRDMQEIVLFDQQGRVAERVVVSQDEVVLPTASLQSGLYYMKVALKNGDKLYGKLAIQQ